MKRADPNLIFNLASAFMGIPSPKAYDEAGDSYGVAVAVGTGPYKLWHHEHEFRSIDGGTEICDLVHYALPLDPLSRPLHELLVRDRLIGIFQFRSAVLRDRFGAPPDGASPPAFAIRAI